MNNNYKRTFDAVRMSQTRQEEIRSELSSRLSIKHKEGYLMNTRFRGSKKYRILVTAVIIVFAFALMGFAFGNQIIELLGGGRIEQGKDSNGNSYTSMDTGFSSEPIKVSDGQIYFVLDGSNTNITNQCSEESYYEYEKISEDGYRHVVVIGGTPENVGTAEFVWDASGNYAGSNGSYNSDEKPVWLQNAEVKLLQNKE